MAHLTTNDLQSIRHYIPYGPPHRTLEPITIIMNDDLEVISVLTDIPRHHLNENDFLNKLIRIAQRRIAVT